MVYKDGWLYNSRSSRFKAEIFSGGEWYEWKGARVPPRQVAAPGPPVPRIADLIDGLVNERPDGEPLLIEVRVHPSNVQKYIDSIPTKDQWRIWVVPDEAEIP